MVWLFDELQPPDIERIPRMYCWECAKRTPYRRGFEGIPVCLVCEEKESGDE